eukprot:gene28907-35913_t
MLRTAISWTGGKDSSLALRICQLDPRFSVVSLVVFRPEEASFKAHPLEVMRLQAKALGLPLYEAIVGGPDYKDSYKRGLNGLRERHDVSVIATGDMDLVGSMERNWIEECCEGSNAAFAATTPLRAYLPLWGASRVGVLDSLLGEGMRVKFSCVKSPWFNAEWIGREIDREVVKELERMHEINQVDIGGEKGEYHTMCVGGPIYQQGGVAHLELEGVNVVELESQKGQGENAQWWVLGFEAVHLRA